MNAQFIRKLLMMLPCHCVNDGWYTHRKRCVRGFVWGFFDE